ncbi:aminoglycoside phosphotransferase [Streptomyces sp. NPDC003036]|uniref:aminoglycoside phosphotransferase n=1 Tax=Streptomyces sp. NPDC003036 TaxID=3154442 RepID=UPI0033AB975D
MTTPTWDDLPALLRHRIADHFQPTGPAEPVAGGFTPGVRVRMRTATGGEVFIKAIPAHGPLADLYRTEAAINRTLPDGLGPRLLTTMDTDGWVVLAFTYAEGRHPDLSPGSPDLPAVLDAVAALHTQLPRARTRTRPNSRTTPSSNARPRSTTPCGDTLLHCDIRADNILIGEHGPLFVAWALAHRGAAWLDAALMVPQLILAGHTPEEAEKHAAQIPAYRDAPEEAVTAFAASITSYWEQRAHEGVEDLRAYRQRALEAGRARKAHRR